ncbi:MAG TPA: hypothetical protein PLV08_02225 [Flavobacteriales bacterium]|nr:hypothetical protein [Flavobacteriales bacterium]MBK6549801.1 hypothetical protein [Flavobacteriales bacterium]MBK7102319.1 hypothetical protein [Flavobacteriales bacterium]MBK7113057.1 hypothetical protein [Flavobacteriales bacterium]MBK7482946.1 hypothetical protein [Flavobacteriales bacterium]
MLRLALIIILASLSLSGWSQGLMQRKRPDIIPLDGQARRIGFYVAPGLTFTLPRFKDKEEEVYRSGDTSYTTTYDPNGRLGLYLEAGLSWYTRDPVIVDYLDLGVAYKNLRGAEKYTGQYQRADSVAELTAEGAFAERMITLHFNANKFIPTWRYQFVQLTLGANADYRLGSSQDHTGDPILNEHQFPPDLWTQLHFKLGYGFKITGNMLLIPAIETPIFSVLPEDGNRFGALQWFSSNYRPLIFSVRFLFLRARKGFDCPPPIKHKGQMKTYKQDGYHPK